MTKQIVEDIKYLLEAEDANREVSAEEKKEKRKKFLKRLAMIGIPVAALATAGAVAYKKGVGPFKKGDQNNGEQPQTATSGKSVPAPTPMPTSVQKPKLNPKPKPKNKQLTSNAADVSPIAPKTKDSDTFRPEIFDSEYPEDKRGEAVVLKQLMNNAIDRNDYGAAMSYNNKLNDLRIKK